jgi:hypothetical protein
VASGLWPVLAAGFFDKGSVFSLAADHRPLTTAFLKFIIR